MRAPTSAVLAVLVAVGAFVLAAGTARADALAGNGFSSSYAGESVFEEKAPGQSLQFAAIFVNDGSQPWTPGVVGLLICLPDKATCNVPSPNAAYASGWFSSTAYATVTNTVAPGERGFFIYGITVPAGTPPKTTVTFNGDVGLIATGALLRPEGYYHQNTTPPVLGTLQVSPTSVSLPVGGQQQFSVTTNLTGSIGWSVTGGCGGVTSGVFVAIAITSAGQPCSLAASAGGLSASAAITVFGSPASLSCASTPASVVANGGVAPGGVSALTVEVRDVNGNKVATSSLGLAVTNGSPLVASVTPTGSVTAADGVATIAVASTLETGQIAVAVSAAAPITGCTALIPSVPAGPPTQTVATFSPTAIGADGISTATLRIEVRDASGNRTRDGSTIIDVQQTAGSGSCAITAVLTGAGGSSGGASAFATDSDGRVDLSVRSGVVAGLCVFAATARTPSIAASTATLITRVVGQPVKLSVIANDTPHSVGSLSATTITVAVQDALGTQVSSSSLPITARPDADPCSGAGGGDVVVSSAGGTTGGIAVFRFTSKGAYAGCVVRFSADGVSGTYATIVFTPGGADHLGCAFTPSTISADRSSTAAALVTVRDAFGNMVVSGSYSVSLSRTAGDGVTTLIGPMPRTMTGGIVVLDVRSVTTAPGVDIYTPSLASGTLLRTAPDQPCTISAAR